METKFVDSFEGIISVKANVVKSKNAVSSVGVQLKPMSVNDGEVQTDRGMEVSSQTDDLAAAVGTPVMDQDPNYNWHTLNDFLLRTEPLILRTIADNRRTFRLFAAYDASTLEDESESNFVLEHSLKSIDYWPEGAQVMALSWNSSGTTIGVACGRMTHEDWCNHSGFIMTWNIDRSRLNIDKADHVYETRSCCTCLSFHPNSPHLFAACTYTGEVAVWSLLEEGEATYSASYTDQTAVNSVAWIPPLMGMDSQALATGGANGNIIFWSLPSKGRQLTMMKAFQMRISNLPRSVRGKVGGETKGTGATTLSFARPPLTSRFMVGTETGGVFQCSSDTDIGSQIVVGESAGITYYDPVILSQKPHNGPVYSVTFHPLEQTAIASCGADGLIRIGAAFQTIPAVEIDTDSGTIYDLSWSPFRPCVFACATGNGRLLICDLTRATDRPIARIETSNEKLGLLAVSFNTRRPNILATGDTTGYVKIWNIGEGFASAQPGEQDVLAELLAGSESIDDAA